MTSYDSRTCEGIDTEPRTVRALTEYHSVLDDVDPALGEHVDGSLRFVAADGGIIEAGDDGEVLDDETGEDTEDGRPDDCSCGEWNDGIELPCWPCYRDGFETPASASADE